MTDYATGFAVAFRRLHPLADSLIAPLASDGSITRRAGSYTSPPL
ncbi:hypothetical protein EXIGUO8H_170003 [Exiguobacterium sp. 8H]|nr:hypothetical protein EXIGUO8H_170003 [Exiguobacterium sp. 8H]